MICISFKYVTKHDIDIKGKNNGEMILDKLSKEEITNKMSGGELPWE